MDSLIPLDEEHRYLESIIERGRQTFVEVGTALMTIREKRTYRADGWDTFEEYCAERWGWTPQRSGQLIDAATIVTNAVNRFDVLPANERQVQALAELGEPEIQAHIWNAVAAEHGAEAPVRAVREAVRLWQGAPTAEQSGTAEYWRSHDIVHTSIGRMNTLTGIDAADYVARLEGIAALDTFLRNDLAIAEASVEWLRAYAAALRLRLGESEQRGLRAV